MRKPTKPALKLLTKMAEELPPGRLGWTGGQMREHATAKAIARLVQDGHIYDTGAVSRNRSLYRISAAGLRALDGSVPRISETEGTNGP